MKDAWCRGLVFCSHKEGPCLFFVHIPLIERFVRPLSPLIHFASSSADISTSLCISRFRITGSITSYLDQTIRLGIGTQYKTPWARHKQGKRRFYSQMSLHRLLTAAVRVGIPGWPVGGRTQPFPPRSCISGWSNGPLRPLSS